MVIKLIGKTKNLQVSSEEMIIVNESDVNLILENLCDLLKISISSLEINFVTNDYILEINKKHLQHNYYTDIITFNYSGENNNLDGELYISFDEAIENSKRFDCKLKDELTRLVIHGVLHLVGYDDMNEKDKIEMKEKENELVTKICDKISKEFVSYEN